jgi:hypothetical protein
MIEASMPALFARELHVAAPRAADAGLRAEDHQRSPDADLVAELQRIAVRDARAVDVRAVGAAQVAEDPVVLAGNELGVAAADRVVRQRQLAAVAPDQRRRVGQLKAAAFVGTLEDKEGEHGRILTSPNDETRNPQQ